MRLPYLQVTQESFSRARMLGALLGVSRREALGLISELWAWALDLGPADKPPTGELVSTRASVLMAGALEWPGDRAEALTDALEEVGLIESFGQGIRVRGMDRYHGTWKKNRRHPPGIPPASERMPHGLATEPGRQTQTQTQTQILPSEVRTSPPAVKVADPPPPDRQPDRQNVPPAAPELPASAPPSPDRQHVPRAVTAPTTPPDEWLGMDFWQWAQWKRSVTAGLAVEKPPHLSKLNAWWSSARASFSTEVLQEAFMRYGDDDFWQRKTPPLPFAGFMSQWDRFIPPTERPPDAT